LSSDTLQAHIKAYRAGTISIKDHQDMVEALVSRADSFYEAVDDLKKRFDSMRDNFVEMLEDE
jgi:hypothetical protein